MIAVEDSKRVCDKGRVHRKRKGQMKTEGNFLSSQLFRRQGGSDDVCK